MKFSRAIKDGRIVVNAAFVGMGADKKLVLAIYPAHRRFKANFVGLLRRHFVRRKRLPHLGRTGPRAPRLGRRGGRKRFPASGVEPVSKPLLRRLHNAQSSHLLIRADVGRGCGSTSSNNKRKPSGNF